MSDNNVCQKCGKPYKVCPYAVPCPEDCAPNRMAIAADKEITRLRSELKKAERERDDWREVFEREMDGARELREDYGARDSETFPAFVERLHAERNEARKWARFWYRAYYNEDV